MKKRYIIAGIIGPLIILLGIFVLVQKIAIPPKPITPHSVLAEIQTYLNTKGTPRQSLDYDWIGENGEHLPLSSSMLVIGTVSQNGMGAYGDIKDHDIQKVTKEFTDELSTKVDTFFTSHGFTKNVKNTATFPEFNSARTGYENGDIKCISVINTESDPFAYFVCGTIDMNQLALMKEFNNLIDKDAEKKNIGYVFRVQKVEGDFAQGYFSNMVGAGWFAKKINGKWEMVIRTPDEPLCTEVQKYGIPESIYGHCWSPTEEES